MSPPLNTPHKQLPSTLRKRSAPRCALSNLNRSIASNISVNSSRKRLILVTLFTGAVAVGWWLSATLIELRAQQAAQDTRRLAAVSVAGFIGRDSLRGTPNFNFTFEKYGPQATARAVRASLLATLTPDPVAMGALLFCAFALRWMRMRGTDKPQIVSREAAGPKLVSPNAA